MDRHLQASWDHFLREIYSQISSQKDFSLWFEPLRPVSVCNNKLRIRIPSEDYYHKIEDAYLDLVSQCLEKSFGKGIELEYEAPSINTHRPRRTAEQKGTTVPAQSESDKSDKAQQHAFVTHLDSRMRMENFFQSSSNKLVCAAATSIIQKPGDNAFNPLFVYGASGVGKTHILHAIGNELMSQNPKMRAVYVPAQTFKRQYVEATITQGNPDLFFNYYHNIDLLLIDDIQEFSEARSTQNAFFQIFNNMKLLGKQIIITSDRPPAELNGLEERLYTRLKWGLTVEIERPDVQLRRMILAAKVQESGIAIPEDVFRFIVKHAKENVRDIEGAFTSLLAHSIYNNVPLDISLAERVLSQTVGVEEVELSVPEILDFVCKYYNISPSDVKGKKRKREIVQARHIVMLISKEHTETSLAAIGAELGGRSHSTIIHGVNKIIEDMETSPRIAEEVQDIKELLNL